MKGDALLEAAKSGNIDKVNEMLAAGGDANFKDMVSQSDVVQGDG